MKKRASLTIIFFTVFIDLMGFGILIPILPTFASKGLGISDFQIGIIVAVYSLMQFIFNPLMGRLSDRYGRRPLILLTLLTTSFSYLIFSLSNSFILLFISRIVAGIGGSNISVAQAYIADVTTSAERSKGMGLIGAAFGLGFVFGPLIGGYLASLSYFFAGMGAAAFSALAFLFAFIFLKESNTKKNKNLPFSFKIVNLTDLKFIFSITGLALVMLMFTDIIFAEANIYGTFALLGYKVYGFTDAQNGLMFGVIGIAGSFVQLWLIRYLTDYFKERSLLLAGALLMGAGLAFMPYGKTFAHLAFASVLFAFGVGTLQPVILSLVSRRSPDSAQGLVLGLNQSMASFASVLGPIWGGFAFQYLGYPFPFLTGSLFAFFIFIVALFTFKKGN